MKIRYSALVEAGFGRDGNLVIRDSRYGPIAVKRAVNLKTPTQAQKGVRNNLRKSAKSYPQLTDGQMAAWEALAKSTVRKDPITQKSYSPTAISMRVELGAKFLQINPGGTLPLMPPATPFVEPSAVLSVVAQTSALVFTSTAGLAEGIQVELLTQSLKSRGRTPSKDGYVSRGFFPLKEEPGLSISVPTTAGTYACAYRFVSVADGRMTDLQLLGKVTVALSVVEGGVDQETGEVLESAARPRMKKAA